MIKGLPDKLHLLRTKYHFSQKQVAERIGVSPSIVSGYETGERTPSLEVLLSLSYLYQCSTDYLLGKVADEPMVLLPTEGLTEKQTEALYQLIDAIRE